MGVPLDEEAAVFAVDTAVECGQRLVVANVTPLEPLRMSIVLGYDTLPELTPEVSASLRRSAELARSLGVHVERVRVRSPRPTEALVELVADVHPGLLVFGPDRTAMQGPALPASGACGSGAGRLSGLGSRQPSRLIE